jgi:hypothetical protein
MATFRRLSREARCLLFGGRGIGITTAFAWRAIRE